MKRLYHQQIKFPDNSLRFKAGLSKNTALLYNLLMVDKVVVYDPTSEDSLSRVRGVGRYLQILKENFSDSFDFVDFNRVINFDNSVFINPFFNFLNPPLTLKRLAKKQIAVIHDLIPLKYGSYFPAGIKGNFNIFLNKMALYKYDLIITDSEASKSDIVRMLKVKEKNVRVVYPCLPKHFSSQEKGYMPETNKSTKLDIDVEKFCLYVGDATWNKNLVNLAKAIKIVNANCIFAGKVFEEKNVNHPWQAELKSFLKEVKDDKRFIFTGYISDHELLQFYKRASVNILPSRDEGFGFSYVEAAANSCPSVLSNIPVLREISDDKALFADPENPSDLAKKIGDVYFNRDLRNRLGRQSYKRSLFFGAEKFKTMFMEAIEI